MRFNLKDEINTKCDNCTHATRMKTRHHNIVFCHLLERKVLPAVECNSHRPENSMDLFEMKRLAWDIKPKKNVGFTASKPKTIDEEDWTDPVEGD